MILSVYYLIYRAILWIFFPFLISIFLFHSIINLKQWRAYLQKFTIQYPNITKEKPIIWIHGVSAGEVSSVQSLIPYLEEQYNIFISTSTMSGAVIAKKLMSQYPSVFMGFYPFDYPLLIRRIIKKLEPKALFFIEGEIWPHILLESKKANIPCFLLSARMGEKEFRGYYLLKSFFQNVFNNYAHICVQSEEDFNRLIQLGVCKDKVSICGSIKMDCFTYKSHNDIEEGLQFLLDRSLRVLIAASTHPKDEKVILKAYEILLKKHPNLKLILVPRHPERASKLKQRLTDSYINCYTLSELRKIKDSDKKRKLTVLVVDTMGELVYLYSLADFVFLGGTFDSRLGGHNPIEPASLGKAIILGPHTKSIDWIVESLNKRSALFQISKNSSKWVAEFISAAEQLILDEELRVAMGSKAKLLMVDNKGSAKKTLDVIMPYLYHRQDLNSNKIQ